MKYIRYMASNKEHVGIIKDDIIYDLDYSCIIDAIAHEDEIDINESTTTHRLEEVDVLPPTNPSKIVCVGLNYKDIWLLNGKEYTSIQHVYLYNCGLH